MTTHIFDDHADLSFRVARLIAEQIKTKPDSVICFASGESPLLAYNLLVTLLKSEKIETSKFTLIGLDEWIDITPENPGSCAYFLHSNLIQPLNLSVDQYRLFNALTEDLSQECETMDKFILKKGSLDMIIVGIGMNGHIGFNEPGVPQNLYSHVIDLDETTRTVGQKYFEGKTQLSKGITLGLQYVREAKTAILMASGERKAPIIRETLEGEITTTVPATMMRELENGHVMIDRNAASLLKPQE
ncbi:6-phosphogluconolactonase [Dyadobacter sp. CY312]|uniref:6-phosphogluconolactonase n=1 Tax=Dyadobacter sp. CY312 TaxID=2907303 RepID=UPI001F3C7E21|nr:glucosamine-6-phosphate deaminase [Dyadobacter sp. CY312]MCE7040255.1 glucosamine-6-phosphate deaminase [Dyadobacter sp. CY312]